MNTVCLVAACLSAIVDLQPMTHQESIDHGQYQSTIDHGRYAPVPQVPSVESQPKKRSQEQSHKRPRPVFAPRGEDTKSLCYTDEYGNIDYRSCK